MKVTPKTTFFGAVSRTARTNLLMCCCFFCVLLAEIPLAWAEQEETGAIAVDPLLKKAWLYFEDRENCERDVALGLFQEYIDAWADPSGPVHALLFATHPSRPSHTVPRGNRNPPVTFSGRYVASSVLLALNATSPAPARPYAD